jgi:CubicO group peptidase (beta-lactamase class C family)
MTEDRSLSLPTGNTDAPALTTMPATEISREAERLNLEALEISLSEMCKDLRLAGMAAGIYRGPELLWFKGFGFSDLAEKTPVTQDTPFHLASLTKTFASTLLMQLVEQGKLDLDTPAATFGIDLESRGTITVRHLLSHTSEGKPGERYRYNGSRFAQLEHVFEQITGRSFKDNLEEIIIKPLGLKNTGGMADALEVRLASPYQLDATGNLIRGNYPASFSCSAGLIASVADYATYIASLKQNFFLQPQTQAIALTPTKSPKGRTHPYGLGWFVETIEGTRVIWHYGYWDSVSTLVIIVPETNLTFLAFANSDALSSGIDLDRGHIARSPAGLIFLENFVLAPGRTLPRFNILDSIRRIFR